MSLNPITALSEQLQRLINEHGSAAILRDHLALFKDQVLLLEKENLRLTNENGAYKINDEKLNSDIEHLKTENEILRSKVQECEQSSHGNLLEQIKVDILLYMSKYEETYVQQLANALKIGSQTALFHLEDLLESDMVNHSICLGGENHWYLTKEGRRYLVRNELIT
jgi:predicted HTH transcriptional regulator